MVKEQDSKALREEIFAVETRERDASDRETRGEEREEWDFLIQIEDDREVDIIESLFRSFQIPLLRRYREAGSYLKVVMGLSVFGVDLYVPRSKLELARKILKTENNTED